MQDFDLYAAVELCNDLHSNFGVALNKTSLKGPLAKKFNISAEDLTAVITALNPSNKRITFRTRLQDAYLSEFAEKGLQFEREEAEAIFDNMLEGEEKKSNILKHRDYYIDNYFGFGERVLLAIAQE